MIVKLVLLPLQLPLDELTVIVPVIGAAVPLVAVKLGILPTPPAPSPIAVFEFVQLYTVPAGPPLNVTAFVADPAHTVWLPTPFTPAFGFTVIVNVTAVPLHVMPALVNSGVTVIVAVTGAPVLLIAVKDGTVPLPDAARPIDVLLLDQLYTVPGTGPLIVTAAVDVPLHTVWFAIAFTLGVGFTVTVKLLGTPRQVTPPRVSEGVIVIVATTGAVPLLVAVYAGILPTPAPAIPIEGCVFVHWNTVPTDGPYSDNSGIAVPLHTTALLSGVLSSGVGFTVIVNVIGAPLHVIPPLLKRGVTVIVATTGPVVLLIAVKLAILPVPLAANPMLGVLFVHVNTVPGTEPLKLIAAVGVPLHTVWFATGFTVGVGFTV